MPFLGLQPAIVRSWTSQPPQAQEPFSVISLFLDRCLPRKDKHLLLFQRTLTDTGASILVILGDTQRPACRQNSSWKGEDRCLTEGLVPRVGRCEEMAASGNQRESGQSKGLAGACPSPNGATVQKDSAFSKHRLPSRNWLHFPRTASPGPHTQPLREVRGSTLKATARPCSPSSGTQSSGTMCFT